MFETMVLFLKLTRSKPVVGKSALKGKSRRGQQSHPQVNNFGTSL